MRVAREAASRRQAKKADSNQPHPVHPRLAKLRIPEHKALVKDGHTTHGESSFGKKLWCVLLILLLGVIGWQIWKINPYNNAVREAEESRFGWTCDDAISLIRQDWRNALKKETWGAHERLLGMGEVPDLSRYREMLHHLNPTVLDALGCQDENLDALNGLTGLQNLDLRYCPALQNVDALKGLTGLQELRLDNCPALQNVDVLKSFTGLKDLTLIGCTALKNVDVLKDLTSLQKLGLLYSTELQNVDGLKDLVGLQSLWLNFCNALQNIDGLKGLAGLQNLYLIDCTALQNVDGLKGIAGLQTLYLNGCDKIPAAALRELRAALPKTDIIFPDGTKNPPQ